MFTLGVLFVNQPDYLLTNSIHFHTHVLHRKEGVVLQGRTRRFPINSTSFPFIGTINLDISFNISKDTISQYRLSRVSLLNFNE